MLSRPDPTRARGGAPGARLDSNHRRHRSTEAREENHREHRARRPPVPRPGMGGCLGLEPQRRKGRKDARRGSPDRTPPHADTDPQGAGARGVAASAGAGVRASEGTLGSRTLVRHTRARPEGVPRRGGRRALEAISGGADRVGWRCDCGARSVAAPARRHPACAPIGPWCGSDGIRATHRARSRREVRGGGWCYPHHGPKKKWWSRGESNPLPRHCERRALPDELRPHVGKAKP